jgi:hypothetical protein
MINFDDSSNAAVRILNETLPQDPRRVNASGLASYDDPSTIDRSGLVDAVGGQISTLPAFAGTTTAGKIAGTAYNTFKNINAQSQAVSDDSVIAMETVNAVRQATTNAQGLSFTRKLSIQPLPMGFGSYLDNILPDDVASAAGAFSAAMQQVKNINTIPIEKFAQVVSNIESTKDLPLTGGTNVPVSTVLANQGSPLIALGDGPYGTFTMSNLLGAMSGLPYPWAKIESSIKSLQTALLSNIYKELFLAVEWEGAVGSANLSLFSEVDYVDPGPPSVTYYKYYYQVNSITVNDKGGGYGRGNAPTPTVVINNGGYTVVVAPTATSIIDTNDNNAGSNGAGTFGRVTSLPVTNIGKVYYAYGQLSSSPSTPTYPTIEVQCPPTSTHIPNVGTLSNTAYGTIGWTEPMSTTTQDYINQANAEITTIKSNNPASATTLNNYYNQTGTALTLEQRAREICYDPVPYDPKNEYLSKFPTTLYAFIDGIPTYSINTEPHMYAQTLEAISDHTLIGGQSMVGMMRQERNQARLLEAGIQLDNNISGELDPLSTKILIANGVLTTSHGTTPVANMYPPPDQLGIYDPIPDQYYITDPGLISGDGGAGDDIGLPAGVDGASGLNQRTLPSPLPTGAATEPGSLAGSRYQNIIPTQLNTAYTSGVLPSSVYSVQEAIDQVIKCNCDCWIN